MKKTVEQYSRMLYRTHTDAMFRRVAATRTTVSQTAANAENANEHASVAAQVVLGAQPGTEAFRELDTDGDGALTMNDDPYAPYYPGDQYVDWVGISLYHWGNHHPWGNNDITEPDKFSEMLTGTYTGTAGDDLQIPDFYHVYGGGTRNRHLWLCHAVTITAFSRNTDSKDESSDCDMSARRGYFLPLATIWPGQQWLGKPV